MIIKDQALVVQAWMNPISIAGNYYLSGKQVFTKHIRSAAINIQDRIVGIFGCRNNLHDAVISMKLPSHVAKAILFHGNGA